MLWCAVPSDMVTDARQLGMHKSVQDHTNANVCKQTYDASCSFKIYACTRPGATPQDMMSLP